jgi:hypothetical protein
MPCCLVLQPYRAHHHEKVKYGTSIITLDIVKDDNSIFFQLIFLWNTFSLKLNKQMGHFNFFNQNFNRMLKKLKAMIFLKTQQTTKHLHVTIKT